MTEIKTLGPVGLNPLGEYNSETEYEKLDVVLYQGSSYVALQTVQGQVPTNTEYWQKLVSGGVGVDDIVDNLDSNDGEKPLSAKQGKKLNITKVTIFDTVADMKADLSLKAGMTTQTLGYYDVNDGGGATYKITNVESEIDYQEELDNELYATLITDNKIINVLQYGVKRNIEIDQSVKVNEILQSSMKKTIYFPNGKYHFENGLVNNNRHDIIGTCNTVTDYDRNINGTRFYFTNLEDNTILVDCSNGSRCSVRDIYIICDNVEITLDKTLMSDGTNPIDIFTKTTKNSGITGIKLGNFGNQLINVAIYGCNLGIDNGTYNVFENIGILCCETGIELYNDNVITTAQILRCETGMIIKGALNNLSQVRLDSIRYYGIEINSDSNNITNMIADICQYASIKLSNAQNNYIAGSIGRSGTYYANFEPDASIDAGKACKIYIYNNSHNNVINITAYKSNALDSQPPYLKIPTYVIANGYTNGSNNTNNNITITGQVFESAINENTVLAIDELDKLFHVYKGSYSGNITYEGITYIITSTLSLSKYNIYVIKPIKYYENYATLNENGNLDLNSKKITNVEEIRLGESTNGWATLSRSSSNGNLKVQNMNTSYVYSNAQITGVANPTTSNSAVNKDYVDNN